MPASLMIYRLYLLLTPSGDDLVDAFDVWEGPQLRGVRTICGHNNLTGEDFGPWPLEPVPLRVRYAFAFTDGDKERYKEALAEPDRRVWPG